MISKNCFNVDTSLILSTNFITVSIYPFLFKRGKIMKRKSIGGGEGMPGGDVGGVEAVAPAGR